MQREEQEEKERRKVRLGLNSSESAGMSTFGSFKKMISLSKTITKKKHSSKKASSNFGSTGISGISNLGGTHKQTIPQVHDAFDEPHDDVFEEPVAPPKQKIK